MTCPEPSRDREPAGLTHAELALFAHELRGALTVVTGYGALLRHPLSDKEHAAALDGIERAVARIDALCADALEGNPPAPAKSRANDLISVVDLAEQAAADQHSATGRTVRVQVDAPADLIVRGDGQALARVLGNLVGNAAKYSPADKPLDVRVSREQRPFLGDAAVVEVADRGAGIPADMRERVFEPFERLERDADTPGTGLGLVVVKNVIAAHDGRVDIIDREGGGTVVRIELPAEPTDAT